MKNKKLLCGLISGISLMVATQASAGAILVIADGILTGAKNVSVYGNLYDVTFRDGTCTEIFNGCATVNDFAFKTQQDAGAAAQALLDQVFLDGNLGNFDTQPGKISGCRNPSECYAFIPYQVASMRFDGMAAKNFASELDDGVITGAIPSGLDLERIGFYTLAHFQLSENPVGVPEPTSIALIGLGLAGLAFSRRRKS